MKRQAFFFAMLAVLILVSNGFSESGGIVDSAVNVIAKDGIFTVGGSGKQPLPQACASTEVSNFLDSAGAAYIEKIFPDFDRRVAYSLLWEFTSPADVHICPIFNI